ncbi:MAG: 2-oxoacid:acceptor oxidoreductase family protein [Tepidanaerobacteraceae bacterium]|nr:2-oxoacid:acceptor oxidoreductase family protein [Tepidanaerobacteraceae bacterium]
MKKLKFFGTGGQGVVTAAKIFSTAVSLYEDMHAITVPAYGHERRGAPVITDVVMDSEPILMNSFVYVPDIVVVMDETIIDKHVDVSAGKHDGTVLVLNSEEPFMLERYKKIFNANEIFYVDATHIALEVIGKGIPNGSMLGALAATGVVEIDSIEKAIRESFGEKAGDMNAAAARKAYENVKKL